MTPKTRIGVVTRMAQTKHHHGTNAQRDRQDKNHRDDENDHPSTTFPSTGYRIQGT